MATDWRITGQQQETRIGGNSQFVDVIRVSFETVPEGIAGSILIPLNLYGPEAVEEQVNARVAVLKSVHNL